MERSFAGIVKAEKEDGVFCGGSVLVVDARVRLEQLGKIPSLLVAYKYRPLAR
jgi:hypothetical protein